MKQRLKELAFKIKHSSNRQPAYFKPGDSLDTNRFYLNNSRIPPGFRLTASYFKCVTRVQTLDPGNLVELARMFVLF